MPTFTEPTDKMMAAFDAERARPEHSGRLATVNIQVLAAYASQDEDGEPRGEALTLDGKPALAKIRILTLEDKSAAAAAGEDVAAIVDVRLILNGDRWGSTSGKMQRGAIDHCLEQIEVQQADGKPKLDDIGRPKVRKKPYDYVLKGYTAVAERHGKSSIEVHEMAVLMDDHGQCFMPFLTGGDPVDRMILAARPKKTKPAIEDKPKPKALGNIYVRGKASQKTIVERLEQLDRPATILGIARLEYSEKPRPAIEKALKQKAHDLGLTEQFTIVTDGDEPDITPDLAAAVLIMSKGRIDESILDQLVPECGDTTVLEWELEEERDRGESSRDHIVQVLVSRIDEIDQE